MVNGIKQGAVGSINSLSKKYHTYLFVQYYNKIILQVLSAFNCKKKLIIKVINQLIMDQLINGMVDHSTV